MSNSITNTNATSRASSLISEHRAAAGFTPSGSTQSGSTSPGATSTASGGSFASNLIEQHRSAANGPANTGPNNRVNYESTPLPSYANHTAGQAQTQAPPSYADHMVGQAQTQAPPSYADHMAGLAQAQVSPSYANQTQTQAPPSYADHMAGQAQTSVNGTPGTDPQSIASGGHKPSMGVGSLRESAVGSGGGLLTGDYANVYDPNAVSLGGEDTSAGMHDYTSSRQNLGNGASTLSEAGTSYGAEVVWDENNFSASASAGAGAYTGLDWADEHGNYGNANAAAHTSVGAKTSNTLNEESGIRSITNGVGAGATASVGGYIGDEEGYTSANVAASVDMNAEATIHTTEGGIPVGVAANVGGDIGVEGEITQNIQTDKGFSETTISGGADIGMGAGAELGMNSEGNFVVGGDIDLGPIGGGVYMELDINAFEEHGKLIDDKWHDGDYAGATAQTADMLWDTVQTVPGLGVPAVIADDAVKSVIKSVNEFSDGDVLGGFEALGDGFLDAWENLPLAGDGLGVLRDWVTGGGIKDAVDMVGDIGEDIGEGIGDAVNAVADFREDAINTVTDLRDDAVKVVGGFVDESLDRAADAAESVSDAIIGEKATEAIKDAASDVGDEIKDVADDIGDGIKDVGKSIGKVFGF